MGKKRDPYRVDVGRRLEVLRLTNGFATIRAFAKELGVEEDRYDAWEKGKSLIPPQTVEVLKLRFGVTSDWIYFNDPSGLTVAVHDKVRKRA